MLSPACMRAPCKAAYLLRMVIAVWSLWSGMPEAMVTRPPRSNSSSISSCW